MRLAMRVLTTVLGALLLLDGIVVYRLICNGWPKRLVVSVSDSTAQVQAVPIGMTGVGWAIVAGYVLIHAFLCYGVWRLRRKSRRTIQL